MNQHPTMDRERFEAMAEAYGGDLDRWPTDAVGPARALLDAEPALAAVLRDADSLDALLAASPTPTFSGVLRERVIGAAPRLASAWKATTRWLSGAGLAAACAAGVIMGVNLSDRIISDPATEALAAASTSFDSQSDILGIGEIG
jgi:hypothetical protein